MNVLRDVARTIPTQGPCARHPARVASYRVVIRGAAELTVLLCFDCTSKTLAQFPASVAVELTRRD